MLRVTWACIFLVFGFLVATPSFAGQAVPEEMSGKVIGDHFQLATYYEEQAQANKSKAENWEFMADYYEKFPKSFTSTTMTVKEHIAHCRSAAEDFRKAEQEDRGLAKKHRSLMRIDAAY